MQSTLSAHTSRSCSPRRSELGACDMRRYTCGHLIARTRRGSFGLDRRFESIRFRRQSMYAAAGYARSNSVLALRSSGTSSATASHSDVVDLQPCASLHREHLAQAPKILLELWHK
nr:hypothetical protein CFP56_73879 [Quercus suber]